MENNTENIEIVEEAVVEEIDVEAIERHNEGLIEENQRLNEKIRTLVAEVEKGNTEILKASDICKNLYNEKEALKNELLVLMRKVVIYQEKELSEIKERAAE